MKVILVISLHLFRVDQPDLVNVVERLTGQRVFVVSWGSSAGSCVNVCTCRPV